MIRKAFALGLLTLLTFSLMSLPSAQAKDPVLINAAGATFPYPIYSKWFDQFHKANPDIQINYASVGSGAGIVIPSTVTLVRRGSVPRTWI